MDKELDGSYIRYMSHIEKAVWMSDKKINMDKLKKSFETTQWRPWQMKVFEYVKKPVDAWKIMWIVDEVGG